MELRIKSEIDGAECQYTGEVATNLIKMANDNSETGWMCRGALERALKILNSLEATAPVNPSFSIPSPQVSAPGTISNPKQPTHADARTEILLESLDIACAELAKSDAEGKGISEFKISEIIMRFRDRFSKKNDMYPILNRHFGLQKSRFDILITRVQEKPIIED